MLYFSSEFKLLIDCMIHSFVKKIIILAVLCKAPLTLPYLLYAKSRNHVKLLRTVIKAGLGY